MTTSHRPTTPVALAGADPRQTNIKGSINWSARLPPLFSRARELVEQATGTNLSGIQLHLVDDQQINEEVRHETSLLVNSQFENTDFQDHFLASIMENQAGTYAALYNGRHKSVMVSRNLMESYTASLPSEPQVQDAALMALMIHELVHAADDQRFHIHKKRVLSFRASFAQSATFEGHAQWQTRNICSEAGCLAGLDALDNFMFSRNNESSQLTQSVQAISRNVLEYSYIEGEHFIAALAARPNGDALIKHLLRSPPSDPIQVLNPDSFPDTARELRNQKLIRAGTGVAHPWLDKHWVAVDTSPLKGVNLQSDPERRRAAIDGFTRLITAMVALQLYDQSVPDQFPLEVTVLQTDVESTASLFASTLHANTKAADTIFDTVQLRHISDSGIPLTLTLFRTVMRDDSSVPWRTVIGVVGQHVVQIAGFAKSDIEMENYVVRVLAHIRNNSTT
ncbi:MAG: hypothetical protein V3U76_12465 [Granulosicoccus sp.]